MEYVLHFFKDMYDFNVMILFLTSAYLLVFVDSKTFRRNGLKKEGRLSKVIGFAYAALSISLYIVSLIIKG